ncbi:hypothetical protein PF010_g16343 [Phytophthora fragariae]|uniref:Uncharacterized protein n=1 Tax=Phytophthora fragariae TaxID=53985 RepID=A0A6A4D005_9STRA|nr:hypothetical protein PF010_g16343 [Phytophthora fragariae]KAE9213081.1 hypothetical protein PF002_g18065 [Phytophthora fragariae]KAE9297835.1 hypothetical protein PF001_g16208 [Phytophthora fragariae]
MYRYLACSIAACPVWSCWTIANGRLSIHFKYLEPSGFNRFEAERAWSSSRGDFHMNSTDAVSRSCLRIDGVGC